MEAGLRSVIRCLAGYMDDQPDVAAAYLFGSLVAGRDRSRSDVDVALLFLPGMDRLSRFDRQLAMAADLENLLVRDVDVVDLEVAPPPLQHQVFRRSVLVLDRLPSVRKAFEVRSRRIFLELKPHRARRDQALLEKFMGDDHHG